MEDYKKVFQLIEILIEKKIWEKIDEGKILGVEMPESQKVYYAGICPELTVEKGIMIFEGQEGLSNLRDLYKETEEPFDLVPRLNFIGVFFEEDYEFLTPFDINIQENNPYGDYDGLGFPRFFRKNSGELEKPITNKDLKIIGTVLEQLADDSLRKLQCIAPFNEEIRFTLRKKRDQTWKRSIESVIFTYQRLQINEMQVYPLKKQSTKVFETWHLGLLYHIEPVFREDNGDELIYPRGIFLLDSDDSLINHNIHEGAEKSIAVTKEIIEETIKDLNVRPVEIVTVEEELFYTFKDYFKALDIEMVYDPEDQVLYDFKAFNYEDVEVYDDDLDLGMEDLFYTFLESKGVLPEGFEDLDQDQLDEIMREFQEIIFDITVTVEKSIDAGKTIKKDEHKDLIKDFFLEGLSKKNTNNDDED
jgi:hypothetical protein